MRQNARWFGALLAALLVAGCAGIEPYEPHDYRQDGPKKGLFSGPAGEFVIYRKADAPEAGSGADNRQDETAGGEHQKVDSEEKKEETKSGEQQP
jgi:hypothetical protein